MRGEGGVLRNSEGKRFMFEYIPDLYKADTADTFSVFGKHSKRSTAAGATRNGNRVTSPHAPEKPSERVCARPPVDRSTP